jgi:hypothetical protein
VIARPLHRRMPAFCCNWSGILRFDDAGSVTKCLESGASGVPQFERDSKKSDLGTDCWIPFLRREPSQKQMGWHRVPTSVGAGSAIAPDKRSERIPTASVGSHLGENSAHLPKEVDQFARMIAMTRYLIPVTARA